MKRLFFAVMLTITLHASYITQHYSAYRYVLEEFDVPKTFIYSKEFERFAKKHERHLKQLYHQSFAKRKEIVEEIRKILLRYDMSDLFLYVALVESGFASEAISSAKAVGVWQFMAPTAKRFNLQVDDNIDQRKDYQKATLAAIKYLRTLKRQFGKWYLALMAYNCGEGCLQQAIKKTNNNSLEALLSTHSPLPLETKEYIQKILLSALIGEGTMLRVFAPPLQTVEVVFTKPILLRELANKSHTPLATLKRLNPHITSTYAKGNIALPIKGAQHYFAALQATHQKTYQCGYDPKSSMIVHTVALGESLQSICRQYGCNIDQVQCLNRLNRTYLIESEPLLIPAP